MKTVHEFQKKKLFYANKAIFKKTSQFYRGKAGMGAVIMRC